MQAAKYGMQRTQSKQPLVLCVCKSFVAKGCSVGLLVGGLPWDAGGLAARQLPLASGTCTATCTATMVIAGGVKFVVVTQHMHCAAAAGSGCPKKKVVTQAA